MPFCGTFQYLPTSWRLGGIFANTTEPMMSFIGSLLACNFATINYKQYTINHAKGVKT